MLSEQRDANVHIEAVRYGTDDACNLYTWCPSRKHQKDAELESETSSCGIFVQPAEERLEWVTVLAGCELSSAVPILWRGCSVGCLAFLDGSDSGLESRSLRERDEDDEFMTDLAEHHAGVWIERRWNARRGACSHCLGRYDGLDG
ncbi:Leucine-rich repeats protein [Rhizoctonia solani]|uniref:Leucine-rich repeats protein n=1 Tax=Rhizoctonia solani TaxID=456999 RepID=A0A8H7I1C1_9AGAM|nr:Leucine-rich repeats protein [Rhizoctonia solani]